MVTATSEMQSLICVMYDLLRTPNTSTLFATPRATRARINSQMLEDKATERGMDCAFRLLFARRISRLYRNQFSGIARSHCTFFRKRPECKKPTRTPVQVLSIVWVVS